MSRLALLLCLVLAPLALAVPLPAQETGSVAGSVRTLTPQAVALEGLHVEGQRRRVASATRTVTESLDIPQAIHAAFLWRSTSTRARRSRRSTRGG